MGKRSFTVDPKTPEGLRLPEGRVGASNLVVEYYSARVLPSWGLSWERLRELNPCVAYLSVSGFGHTGPHSSYVSYVPTSQAASRLPVERWASRPQDRGYSFLDVMTGYQAVLAAALHMRRSIGVGVLGENYGVDGARKVYAELNRQGYQGRPVHRRAIDARRGTTRNHSVEESADYNRCCRDKQPDDLVNRGCTASAPGQL